MRSSFLTLIVSCSCLLSVAYDLDEATSTSSRMSLNGEGKRLVER